MNQPGIEKKDNNTFVIKGVLSMQTVPGLEKEARQLITGMSGEIVIDLSGVEHADSSALALLIEWQRLASRHNISVSYSHLPDQLLQIARVSELQDILPIQA